MVSNKNITHPWAEPTDSILEALQVTEDQGLSEKQVRSRRRRSGANRIKQKKRRSTVSILMDQVKNLIVLLLAVAAAVAFVFSQHLEAAAIAIAIVLNVGFGFFTELRATRSMEALQHINRVKVKVRRDGKLQEIASVHLVPGDIVEFESGDIIAADMRALEVSRVQTDEAALTGESAPVEKQVEAVDESAALSDRSSILFKGTWITRGSGRAVVFAVGMETQFGEIAALTDEAEGKETPLEKRLNRLGYNLIWLTLSIAALVVLIGVLAGKDPVLLVEMAIALAVAATPEGLPVVATIALARGLWHMLKQNALMNRLSAVETLGATTVICTDKTGTLTEGDMKVTEIRMASGASGAVEQIGVNGGGRAAFHRDDQVVDPSEHELLHDIIEAGVMCNNAALGNGASDRKERDVGDPMEIALLKLGKKAGIERKALLEERPEKKEEAFDRSVKMMATFYGERDGLQVAVKGAPEAVLNACGSMQAGDLTLEMDESAGDQWLDQNHGWPIKASGCWRLLRSVSVRAEPIRIPISFFWA